MYTTKMTRYHTIKNVVRSCLGVLVVLVCSTQAHTQSAISYETSDGWTIRGDLYLPDDNDLRQFPAVLLLPEPGWVDRSIYDTYLARKLTKAGIAVLAIDVRGTGSSRGRLQLDQFRPQDMRNVQLDIRGGIGFLMAQHTVDPHRIGIVAAGRISEYAVLEAAEQPSVRGVVLISGELTEETVRYIKMQPQMPILAISGKNDKNILQQMMQAYILSPNNNSDLILAVGHGTVMFSHTIDLEDRVIAWLDKNVTRFGTETEVAFKSEDGWVLHGRLHMPAGLVRAPGVVLVHGNKHDQDTYSRFVPELVRSGIAALTFDWRGKGASEAPRTETSFGESSEVGTEAYRDVKAAINFIASQPGIDSSRIGLTAATAGSAYALKAAYRDSRIRTVVLMTVASVPVGEEEEFLRNSGTPIFAIASTEDINYMRGSLAESTRQAHLMSNSKDSQFLLYDDAGRGSEMLKVKSELQGMIIRWFLDKLRPAQ